MKRAYKPNPRHPSGVSNEEAYGLTQRQRALERRIREAKRELRGAQMLYEADPKLENLAGVADAKARLGKRQAAMRKLVAENPKVLQRSPRREWAGDMPKAALPKAAGRSVEDVLEMPSIERKIKATGLTRDQARSVISARLKEDGIGLQDFGILDKRSEKSIIDDAIQRRKTLLPVEERRKNFKPVNPAFLAARKKEIEREGGMVWQDPEATRYLNERGADAATLGDVIALRKDATLSEVLEEEFHFHQNRRGDHAGEADERIIMLKREIDAQRYLLDVAEQYKIPRIETKQTEAALQEYLRQLKEITGEDY